jgi:DNA-binding PucR family transcriptional regulator
MASTPTGFQSQPEATNQPRGAGPAQRRSKAVTNGRLSAALEFRPWLEAVAQISAAVNNMEPLGNVLNAIAATTCGLLGYDFGAVLLADRERLYMRGAHGLAPGYIETINSEKPIRLGHGPFGEGPSSRAFRSHKPVVVLDYRDDPSVGPWAGVAIEQGFRSLAAIPLVVSGRAIGTLNNYTQEVHDFGQDELLLLQTIANQAALAIETARLREQERATIARVERARRSLEAQAAILERSEQIHTQLTRAVLEDAGLDAIAEALTRILGGSVVIDDGGGVVLATAAYGEVALDLPDGALGDRGFAWGLAAGLADGKPLELSKSEGHAVRLRTFVAPVVIERDVVGRLWVIGAAHPMEALERRALEHGATVVALELLKRRIASEVEGRLAGELLGDLLGDRPLDPGSARLRASHLGHDLACEHAAMVVALDPEPTEPSSPELRPPRNRKLLGLVSLLVRRTRAEALVGEMDGRIVLLLADPHRHSQHGVAELADSIRREVRSYMTGATVSVAFGPLSDDVAAHGRSYRIARGALELSQRFGGPDRTVSAETLGVHGLLLSVDRLDELVRFSRNTLGPLRSYDEKRSSELVTTLAAFLKHGCRPGETAEALVVHPNTVAYRVRRIESLLELDLGRPEAQLHVQLALVVDDILGNAQVPPPQD